MSFLEAYFKKEKKNTYSKVYVAFVGRYAVFPTTYRNKHQALVELKKLLHDEVDQLSLKTMPKDWP